MTLFARQARREGREPATRAAQHRHCARRVAPDAAIGGCGRLGRRLESETKVEGTGWTSSLVCSRGGASWVRGRHSSRAQRPRPATRIRRIRLMATVIAGYELLPGATLGAAVLAGGSPGPLRADTIAAVVATTMLAFALGQIWLWRVRGRKTRCGCFGAESVVGWRSIGRAGLLVAVCIPGLVLG